MKRGDIIRYVDMTIEEGFSIQRGMNFNVANKEYGIILMSVLRLFTKVTMFKGITFLQARIPKKWINQ